MLTKTAGTLGLPEAAEGEGVTFMPREETSTALVAVEGATGKAEDPETTTGAALTATTGVAGTWLKASPVIVEVEMELTEVTEDDCSTKETLTFSIELEVALISDCASWLAGFSACSRATC